MIFDITVNDNDFTYDLKNYFDLIHNFGYCFQDCLKAKMKLDYKDLRKIEDTMKDCYTLLNTNFKKLTISEQHLLECELKKDLIHWIKNENVFGSSNTYIEDNLEIKIRKEFKVKDQNGEHLWVYIQPYRTIFALVQ